MLELELESISTLRLGVGGSKCKPFVEGGG